MPPAIPDKIVCTTPAELERELNEIRQVLALPETEDSWEKIARALQKYAAIVRGGATKVEPEFGKALRELSRAITNAMCSERTRLSATACDLLATIVPRLGDRFDSHLTLFMPEVLKLCTRTNKLFIARAQKTLGVIVTHTKLVSVIYYLREAVKDKSHTLRIAAADAVLLCLKDYEPKTLRTKIEDIESIVGTTATDSNPEVRKISKQMFEMYKKQFPDRVDDFSEPLTPVAKRYLGIAPRDKSAAPLKSALSTSTRDPPVPNKHRPELSSSTSATRTAESGPSRPTAHARSASTTVLGQPVRPKLIAAQTEKAGRPDRSISLAKSVNSTSSRPRAPSVTNSSSRPASSLAHAPLTKPVKPTTLSRSVTEGAEPQDQSNHPVRPASVAASRGFMRPTASSKSAQRTLAASTTGPSSSASSAPSRPAITRPPTAPPVLLSSASRRPFSRTEASKSTKASTVGKVLQGGAKRIVSAQSSKAPAATALAQAIRKNGLVPTRGASQPTPEMKELVEQIQEESNASSPPPEVVDKPVATQANQEGECDELSIEDLVVLRPQEVGNDVDTPIQAGPEEAPLESLAPGTDSVGIPLESEEPETPATEPQTALAEEVIVEKTNAQNPSPAQSHRRHAHRNRDIIETEEEKAARVTRHEEKRRAFEALPAEEQEAIRQRKREKRARQAREREELDRRAHDELQGAAAAPLPRDDEKHKEASPVPAPHFAIPRKQRAEDVPLHVAAAVPLPEDADEGLVEPLSPSNPLSVMLPNAQMALHHTSDHESEASSSRSPSPQEIGQTDAPNVLYVEEHENVAPLPEAVATESELTTHKDVAIEEKLGLVIAERLFAEVDINALVR